MFKRNKTKNSVNITQKKTASSELTMLIDKLQKNADKVERNILESEQNLEKDVNKINEGKPPLYQEDVNRKIVNSLELLKGLMEDSANATRLKHPQAEMIEHDMQQLRSRVQKLRDEHDKIYNITRTEGLPSINWGSIIDEKEGILKNKGFGEDLPTVENEVEEHNLFHSEVEALAPHLANSDSSGNLPMKYNKLLAASSARQRELHSLRDFMQRCTNELYWMDQQGRERMGYDWSDANLDYPIRQRQYESFITKSLEAKEETITKLNSDAEKLLQANHPGRNVIQAHMEAVHADWKEYLNLLICEENHLKHMEEYHKFQKEARDTQDLLKRLDTDINQKYNPDYKDMYQMEGLIADLDDQAKAMDHYDSRVKALQKRSQQVLPLRYRREPPNALLPVEALCDYDADGGQIFRGEKYTLLKNNGEKWDVKDSRGGRVTAPGVCFMIPPTDPDAVSISENLANQQKTIKQKVSNSKGKLAKRLDDLRREGTGNDKQDQQCRQLMAGLEKVHNDLDKQEKAIYARIRPPLEQNRMVQDTADRLEELKDIEAVVRKIEPEKASKVREADTFLASNPNSPSAGQLYSRVDAANKKCNKVNELLKFSKDKLQNSNRLEDSLQRGKSALAAYENKLARETVAPSDPISMDNTLQDLAEMSSDLRQNKPLITDTVQNLHAAQDSCDILANRLQEHCPDIDRQEAEVQKLSQRYDNLAQQIDNRSQSLQRARSAYNNYRNDYDKLNTWLSRMPNYEPKETDDRFQMESKAKNQMNLLSDIARKEPELKSVSRNSQLYQQAVKEYETETETFKSMLELEDGLAPQSYKRSRLESPAAKVKAEESAIESKFAEVNAINKMRLQNLEFAQGVMNQRPDLAITQQNVQSVHSSAPALPPGEEPWRIRRQLEEEVQRREQLERELQSIQNDIYVLEGQKPQDTMVKKEVIKRVPDPQLDEEISELQQKLAEEQRTTWTIQSELETLKFKLRGIETEKREDAQQYTVKEVLRIEKDKEQEAEVRRLQDELAELRRQRTVKDTEIIEIKRHVTLLAEQKNIEQEVIKEEEVIKVENDPKLESEYRLLLDRKEKEVDSRKELEDELQFLLDKRKRLEKEKAMAEEKISIKEVVKLEKDMNLHREVDSLRRLHEDEKAKRRSSQREKTELQRKIQSLEEEKSKVMIQEKMREIVRPDPKVEAEVANLRFELVEQQRRFKEAELQLTSLQDELRTLRNRGPKIEYKEIIKEVIKYKMDPQTERELETLRNEIVDKSHEVERYEMESKQLKDEIERWKNTKPQVQTKEVVNEVLQYREDPKTKEEVETLKRKLAEEQKKRLDLEREKSGNEEKIRLRKIDLSQVREKYVQQEVVKMEEDQVLKSECETFSKNINNEQRQRETLKDELQRLQRQKSDLELQLQDIERERRARRDAELEIQRLRIRLNELEIRDKENREKVTVKQKVVLQQDPQQEKEHSILKVQVDEERHKRMLLEKELNVLQQQQVTLERMEVKEKVVRSEKVQVERDPEAELEIQRLKRSLEEEKDIKRDLEQQLSKLNTKLSDMDFNNTKSTKELVFLQDENNRMQQDIQRLQSEIRRVQSDIQITVKETKHITESAPVESGGKNLELRLTSLQRELADLKNVTAEKDREIEKLRKNLSAAQMKQEQRESHMRRSIVVIDPDTGREMKPEEAYKLGLIDWKMYVNLQSQECDWEEITTKGSKGESMVLLDRKSGMKFSVEDALRAGYITRRHLQQYQNKELSIQEFGLMVSGRSK
ncbi:hypothetical protein GJAV_G00215220 [Gymnothorax javanicus]|nr:hypothetical protein GJAV_G00215220 [Gymnothorax javanicus]